MDCSGVNDYIGQLATATAAVVAVMSSGHGVYGNSKAASTATAALQWRGYSNIEMMRQAT